jgi:hypothetical protein
LNSSEVVQKKITFGFHPYDIANKNHCIEKADITGEKRRYLTGISSGVKIDAHNEKMTEKCIKSMMEQANSGMVLLYPDVHGIRASEDIGKITTAKILEDGDWYTEYQLYDESDGIGAVKAEKINTIWAQSLGLPPYDRPLQKGFSIEGYIPDDAILSAEVDNYGNMRNRIIDDVKLDGVCLVPKQAYKPAIATAIYKALGEITPYRADKIRKDIKGELKQILDSEKIENEYFKRRWDLMDALDRSIEKIMTSNTPDKTNQLDIIFDEYKTIMVPLIIQSESVFTKTENSEPDENISSVYGDTASKSISKIDLFKSLSSQLEKTIKILDNRMV